MIEKRGAGAISLPGARINARFKVREIRHRMVAVRGAGGTVKTYTVKGQRNTGWDDEMEEYDTFLVENF